jgi:ankyrin repeat protein
VGRRESELGTDVSGSASPGADMVESGNARRPTQPEALKRDKPWMWSPGAGTDVWAMFMASMDGDLDTVKRLVQKDPSLVRSHYEYRTPLGFAVRANQLTVAEFLLDLGAAKVGLGDQFEAARDRELVKMERLLTRKFAQLHGASTAGDEIAAAIRAYDLPRVRALLDASPDLPLAWARRRGHAEIVRRLSTDS